jgi:hypothetical protein
LLSFPEAGGANLSPLSTRTKRAETSAALGKNEKAARRRAAVEALQHLKCFDAIFVRYCLS